MGMDRTGLARRIESGKPILIAVLSPPKGGDPEPVRAAAQDFLSIFRVRQFAVIPIGSEQMDRMEEIGALLDEFREGVKGQVGENDPQAHYDLGVSHQRRPDAVSGGDDYA